MMTRKELLTSPTYWTFQIQNELFQLIDAYLKDNKISRTQFGTTLGVTKGYISQVLNGDFDHKVSKLVSLAMGTGKVPCITFKDLKQVIKDDEAGIWHKDPTGPTLNISIYGINITIKDTIMKPRPSRKISVTASSSFPTRLVQNNVYDFETTDF